jgi:hypothetical protein
MKKTYRRWLLFTSVVIFLGMAPILILYAMGYRAGTSVADPQPIGVALIEAMPRGALVEVDGNVLGASPRSLTNLRSGPIQIKVSAPGYVSWEKRIDIEAGRATDIRDVLLFPEKPEITTLLTGVESTALSLNRRTLIALTSKGVAHIVDEIGTVLGTPVAVGANIESISWSPSNAHVLLRTRGAAYKVVEVTGRGQATALPELAGAAQVVWDPRLPNRLLYLTPQGALGALHTATRATTPLLSDVEAFALSGRSIVAAHSEGKAGRYTLQGELIEEFQLAAPGPVRRVAAATDHLAAIAGDGSVWLWQDGAAAHKIAETAISIEWSPSGEMLLVQPDPFSLQVYNVADERAPLALNTLQLVIRLSRAITHPQWFAGGRHVVYQVADEVHITEIDTRDHPISYQVDTTNLGAAQAQVGEDGDTLFYLKRENNQTNLVATRLIVE